MHIASDSDLLALWRSGLPHAEHVHAALPPAGARIVALAHREEAYGRQRAHILRCALDNAPGTSRKRAAYLLFMVLAYLVTTDPAGGVAQFVGFDMLGCAPFVMEQHPIPRRRVGSLPG
jgi:hypothetical protein